MLELSQVQEYIYITSVCYNTHIIINKYILIKKEFENSKFNLYLINLYKNGDVKTFQNKVKPLTLTDYQKRVVYRSRLLDEDYNYDDEELKKLLQPFNNNISKVDVKDEPYIKEFKSLVDKYTGYSIQEFKRFNNYFLIYTTVMMAC